LIPASAQIQLPGELVERLLTPAAVTRLEFDEIAIRLLERALEGKHADA
jgi:hypothetical protein